MPGAYRDDPEMVRSRLGELRHELSQHRARRKEAAELQKNVAILSVRNRGWQIALAATIAVASGVAAALLIGGASGGPFIGCFVASIAFWIFQHNRKTVNLLTADRRDQVEIRLRVAEMNDARDELDGNEQRRVAEEKRTCEAIEEEIAQLERTLNPSFHEPSPLGENGSNER